MHLLSVLMLIHIILLLLMSAKIFSDKNNVLRGGFMGSGAILARVFFMRLPQPSRGRCELEKVSPSQSRMVLRLLFETGRFGHAVLRAEATRRVSVPSDVASRGREARRGEVLGPWYG